MNAAVLQQLMKPKSGGGLLLLRRITPLARRHTVYFCSGAYSRFDPASSQGRNRPIDPFHCGIESCDVRYTWPIRSRARTGTYWTKVSFDTFVCRGRHSADLAEHFRHFSAKAAESLHVLSLHRSNGGRLALPQLGSGSTATRTYGGRDRPWLARDVGTERGGGMRFR